MRGILTCFLTVFEFLWTWPPAAEERRNKAGIITHRTLAFGIQQIIRLFSACFVTSNVAATSRLSPTFTFIREKLAAAGFFDMDINSIPGRCAKPLLTSNARSPASLQQAHYRRCGWLYLAYRWLMQLGVLSFMEIQRAGCDFGIVLSNQAAIGGFNVRCAAGDFRFKTDRLVSRPQKVGLVMALQSARGRD